MQHRVGALEVAQTHADLPERRQRDARGPDPARCPRAAPRRAPPAPAPDRSDGESGRRWPDCRRRWRAHRRPGWPWPDARPAARPRRPRRSGRSARASMAESECTMREVAPIAGGVQGRGRLRRCARGRWPCPRPADSRGRDRSGRGRSRGSRGQPRPASAPGCAGRWRATVRRARTRPGRVARHRFERMTGGMDSRIVSGERPTAVDGLCQIALEQICFSQRRANHQFVSTAQPSGVPQQRSELVDGRGSLTAFDGGRGTRHDRLQGRAQHRLSIPSIHYSCSSHNHMTLTAGGRTDTGPRAMNQD